MAALQEIAGKERELATDPDCAGGLERMAYSMDDFVRRVFMDSLTGSYGCSHHPLPPSLTCTRQIRVAHQTSFRVSCHPNVTGRGFGHNSS